MINVLVLFENTQHIECNAQKFINNLEGVVSFIRYNQTINTSDAQYKLVGAGFPYVNSLGDKLNGMRFDDVMIHGDVVLTKQVEWYIRTRMKELKEFIDFEIEHNMVRKSKVTIMSRYDWSNIPLNICYIATDSSGWVNGFECEPVLDKSSGLWKGDGVCSLKSPRVNNTRWWDKDSGEYWKDSLEVRVDE